MAGRSITPAQAQVLVEATPEGRPFSRWRSPCSIPVAICLP